MATRIYHPWLTEDHAKRMALLLNEIEQERISRCGGDRARGDGNFYTAKPAEAER